MPRETCSLATTNSAVEARRCTTLVIAGDCRERRRRLFTGWRCARGSLILMPYVNDATVEAFLPVDGITAYTSEGAPALDDASTPKASVALGDENGQKMNPGKYSMTTRTRCRGHSRQRRAPRKESALLSCGVASPPHTRPSLDHVPCKRRYTPVCRSIIVLSWGTTSNLYVAMLSNSLITPSVKNNGG